MNGYSALRQYSHIGTRGSISDASPHRMVTMLMDGALDRISMAKGHVLRNEAAQKGQRIGAAISIIDGLRVSLDLEQGGEMAANLESLYNYMVGRLLEANLHDSDQRLDEVASLLREIKEAWVAIPVELHNGLARPPAPSPRPAANA